MYGSLTLDKKKATPKLPACRSSKNLKSIQNENRENKILVASLHDLS